MSNLHTDTCWGCVIEDIQENAAECFAGQLFIATDEIPGWHTTVYQLAESYLQDGTSSCRCEDSIDDRTMTAHEYVGL